MTDQSRAPVMDLRLRCVSHSRKAALAKSYRPNATLLGRVKRIEMSDFIH
jgi:hypothetical protein